MRSRKAILENDKPRQVNMKDYYLGVIEIIESLIEDGYSSQAKNIILEKDIDLPDLHTFTETHPAYEHMQTFIQDMMIDY